MYRSFTLLFILTVPMLADYVEQCLKTPIEENVTLKGGIGAGTFRKMGKVTEMKSCIELCCKAMSCDVAFMSARNCYAVECVSSDECESTTTDTSDVQVLIAHVKKNPGKANATLDVLANPGLLAKKSPLATGANPAMAGMAGQCKAGKTYREVTLRGGINAGTYKDTGMVGSMSECQKKCCGFSSCDLAFLLQGRCYLVGCADEKSCQMNKANPSVYTPMISYVTRWNTEGVKHTVHFDEPNDMQFRCPAMKALTKVTLKGGLKSGDFTDVGKVGKLVDCYELCCKSKKCDLAFMLGQNCFNVKCYNQDLCKTIPAQPSIFNPQIAYIISREKISFKEALQDQLEQSPAEAVTHVTCPSGHIVDKVTLLGGLNAGKYRDHGKVKNMSQCRRICCEIPKCNIAFMIAQNCFSVECKNEDGCRTQPALHSPYNPRISYVRFIGSSNIIGVYNDLNSTVKNATKNIDDLFKEDKTTKQKVIKQHPPLQTLTGGVKTTKEPPSRKSQQLIMNGNTNDLVSALQQHPKPKANHTALTTQLSKVKAGEAMSLQMINGELTVGPTKHNKKPTIVSNKPDVTQSEVSHEEKIQPSCHAVKRMKDVSLKGGKSAGSFKDNGKVKSMDHCLEYCCKDKKCNLVLMLAKTCYTVQCKDKQSCEPSPAPTSEFTPLLAIVRPVKEHAEKKVHRPKVPEMPENLKCNFKTITNNQRLRRGRNAGVFKQAEGVSTMKDCMETCCDKTMCDLAYFDEGKCFTVTCNTPDSCDTEQVKDNESSVLLAFTSPVETPSIKETPNEEVNMAEENELTRGSSCKPTKITRNSKLEGAKLSKIGPVSDLQTCIGHCCKKENCDAAYMQEETCYTVECQDGLHCRSFKKPANKDENVFIAFMQRTIMNAEKERDWVIVYIIVGSLVCASGLSGIAWASCICIKRNRLRSKRRLLNDIDEDEEEEMIPKKYSRYNNPVPRRYR